jgi:hypothetical protein
MPETTTMPAILSSLWLLIPLMVWDLAWRGVALWKAGRHNHLVWFIFLLIVNSLGILPIIYLLYLKFSKKNQAATTPTV